MDMKAFEQNTVKRIMRETLKKFFSIIVQIAIN